MLPRKNKVSKGKVSAKSGIIWGIGLVEGWGGRGMVRSDLKEVLVVRVCRQEILEEKDQWKFSSKYVIYMP